MIGKSSWFRRRKYSGWGLTPKTWQGWAYVLVICIPFVIFQMIPSMSNNLRFVATGIWILVILIDVFDIMIRLRLDEREKMHEAIAERNAMWSMMIVLTLGLVIEISYNAYLGKVYINPVVIAALIVGVITKGISNFVLERRG